MRTAIACTVVAGVIEMPGVIVAATSSPSHSAALPTGWTGYAPATTITAQALPSGVDSSVVIDPALRPYLDAVVKTFAGRGVLLVAFRTGPATAEAAPTGSGRCLVDITFGAAIRPPRPFTDCAIASIRAGNVTIRYSPPSIGPTIQRAVANLR